VNPWLGAKRGHLSDWTTQQWVRLTGRRVDLAEEAWLDGPAAPTTGIGERFFEELGLDLGRADGLLPSFEALRSPAFDPGAVDPRVVEFYERTAHFRLQLWSQWSPTARSSSSRRRAASASPASTSSCATETGRGRAPWRP
jgi:hypothetical protein